MDSRGRLSPHKSSLPLNANGLRGTGSARFSQSAKKVLLRCHIDLYQCWWLNSASGRGLRETRCGAALNPVMGLWTGCTRLKMHIVTKSDFSLTEIIEGVQQDRSLTAS